MYIILKGGREYKEGKEIAISNLRFDMEEEGDEDRRREAAIAATPVLQPNFQAESVSHEQLQKLKVLLIFCMQKCMQMISLSYDSDSLKKERKTYQSTLKTKIQMKTVKYCQNLQSDKSTSMLKILPFPIHT
jgi:hypothetical protein